MLGAAQHHPLRAHLRQPAGHAEHVVVRRDAGIEEQFRFAASQHEERDLGQEVTPKAGQSLVVHEACAVGGENARVAHDARATHDVVAHGCDGFGITLSEFFDTETFRKLEQEIR